MSGTVIRLQNLVSLTVSHIALNPVVTASLLWVLTRGPLAIRQRLFDRVASLRDAQRFTRIVRALKALLVLGLLGTANRKLNEVALNAWRWKSEKRRWIMNQELAVITGGCSGIGELIVKGLWKKGVKIVVLDIQERPASLRGNAGIHWFSCDITDPAAVNDVADKIRSTIGSPSILINNAGVAGAQTILDMSPDWLRKIFDVNVLSNWYTIKAFLPDMITKNKGHIVTVASIASFISVAGMVDYCSTKAGVLAFHEGLNQELKLHYKAPNVMTTSVHPNWVKTPLIKPYEAALRAAGQPIIEAQAVADVVVQQIVSAQGGQLFLPTSISTISLLRALPNWFQESLRATVSKAVLPSV